MLTEEAKKLFADLKMEFPPVAVKYDFEKPEHTDRTDERLSFCEFVRKAQRENRGFYMTAEDEDCLGKVITGMAPKPGLDASGMIGKDLGLFRTAAPNAVLHATYPVLPAGSVNYVEFCPLEQCGFSPDLVICVANTEQAEILMRATSYISGDLWEVKTSYVASCAWSYIHPYLTGKVNSCTTGMHHGMTRRHLYPAGLRIISIPFQKLDEVVQALGEMEWVPITMRDDPESRAEVARIRARWRELSSVGGLEK